MSLLVHAVDDIAQVEQEGRIECAPRWRVVASHFLAYLLGLLSTSDAAVAECLKSKLASSFDLRDASISDHLRQRHDATANDRWDRSEVLTTPVRHARQAVDWLAVGTRGGSEERMCESTRATGRGTGSLAGHRKTPLMLSEKSNYWMR